MVRGDLNCRDFAFIITAKPANGDGAMPGPNVFRQMVLASATALMVVAPCTSAPAETVLYSFLGGHDGAAPISKLVVDEDGNFYGTTAYGGAACKRRTGCGTVFKLAPDGTETVLYAFRHFRDGSSPLELIFNSQGNLYGVTTGGGDGYCRCGTVFELTHGGKYRRIYSFQGGDDGEGPTNLAADQQGNLFGTTEIGGGSPACGGSGCGTVFEVTPAGAHSVLYAFEGNKHGWLPFSGLIMDAAGNLYGTTWAGGDMDCPNYPEAGCGTVYKLSRGGTHTVLYAFAGGSDGALPSGKLIFDNDGNLYGITEAGGGTGCGGYGCGTVFRIAPDGTETILSGFNESGGPIEPIGGVVMGGKGELFGTTYEGGASGCGTVYEVARGSQAAAIHSFTCGADGGYPEAGLRRRSNGKLYGTTFGGGNGYGTVFAVNH
jgi:uncharacterized repeat protein (TIGR03803 family)